VAEIGGAGFYAWATMVYMVASIIGAASAAPLSTRLGARRGYVLAGLLFLGGSAGCGLSPTMLFLLLARAVQGFGGGLLLSRSVGIANWMFFLQAITHTAVNVFLPLTLQVVHGTPPLIAGYMIAVLALSWTLGSLIVAGWRRGAVSLALAGGQGVAAIGMVGLAFGVVGLPLAAIAGCC